MELIDNGDNKSGIEELVALVKEKETELAEMKMYLSDELEEKLVINFSKEEIAELSKGFNYEENSVFNVEEAIASKSLETNCIYSEDYVDHGGDEYIFAYKEEQDRYIVPIEFDSLTKAKLFLKHVAGRY